MKSLHILFVEDVRDDVDLVMHTLASAGMPSVVTHVDTRPGLEGALKREQFDVALIDFVLPRFGGMEAISITRAATPRLPIVLLTGALDPSGMNTVAARADAHLLKEHVSELPDLIRRLVPT